MGWDSRLAYDWAIGFRHYPTQSSPFLLPPPALLNTPTHTHPSDSGDPTSSHPLISLHPSSPFPPPLCPIS